VHPALTVQNDILLDANKTLLSEVSLEPETAKAMKLFNELT
jgi:hypothetical protein